MLVQHRLAADAVVRALLDRHPGCAADRIALTLLRRLTGQRV